MISTISQAFSGAEPLAAVERAIVNDVLVELQTVGYHGLTIETVSRMLSRLDRAHAILLVPGGVRLLDLPRLEAMAAG